MTEWRFSLSCAELCFGLGFCTFPSFDFGKLPSRTSWGQVDRLGECRVGFCPTPGSCAMYPKAGRNLNVVKVGLSHAMHSVVLR